MKKQELLTLYERGERNFRRQNLSGQCFRGHNLSNADFSGAILKGTNFSRAILRGANFTAAQIGLRPLEALGLGLLLSLLVITLGVITGGVGALLDLNLPGYGTVPGYGSAMVEGITVGGATVGGITLAVPVGWVMLLLLLAFALMAILEGIKTGFSIFALALGLAVAMTAVEPLIGHHVDPITFTIAAKIALAITVLLVITALTLLATTIVMAAWRSLNGLTAVGIALFYLITVWIVVYAARITPAIASVVPAILMLGSYLGWRALQDDPKHRGLRQIAHALTSFWGTNFRDTDLTEATFAQAKLRNTHFEGAILTRVHWMDTEPVSTRKG